LREWLAFHRVVGVEHFIVFDNDSTDHTASVLAPHVADGLVTHVPWPGKAAQLGAYRRGIELMTGRARWVAVIDIDEFLFPSVAHTLTEVLRDYEEHVGVVVNWVSFGSAGLVRRPDGLVIEAFLRRGPLDHRVAYPHLLVAPGLDERDPHSYRPLNTHVKTIADPAQVVACESSHCFEFAGGRLPVDEHGNPVRGPWTEQVSVARLRINHYWSKSRDEFAAKLAKGRVFDGGQRTWEEFERRDAACDGVVDTEILRYVPEVKALLGQVGTASDSA
jgi:hypothetical protein